VTEAIYCVTYIEHQVIPANGSCILKDVRLLLRQYLKFVFIALFF